MRPPRISSLRRGIQIVVAALGFGLAWWRLRKTTPSVLAERLRETLEAQLTEDTIVNVEF